MQAELYLTTGDLYRTTGDLEAADSLLSRGLELRQALYEDGPHEDLAEAQIRLGRLRMAQARFDEAEPLMAEALAQRQALRPAGSEEIAEHMVDLGEAYRLLGRTDEAEELYVGALEMYEALDAPSRTAVAIARNNLALVHHQTGRLAIAMPLYEEAVGELLDAVGPRHPYTLILQHNLAGVNRTVGRYAIADSIFREVVEMENEVNPGSPDAASGLANLGMTLRMRGFYDEAADVLTEALEMLEPLGSTHPSVTLRMLNLANARMAQGRYDEAESLIRDFGRRRVERVGPEGETRAVLYLGRVYARSGRYDEAKEALADALERRRAEVESPHPGIVEALWDLASTHREAGDLDAARVVFGEALEIARALEGRETDTVELLTEVASLELDAGRPGEAEEHLREARELIGSDLPPGTQFQVRMELQYARLLLARGNGEAALETVRSVAPWYERQFAPAHHERADVMGVEGEILVSLGRLEEAEPLLLASDEILAGAPAAWRRASAVRLEALADASRAGRPPAR